MSELTLTMTLDQAYAIVRMLDLATRIHLCQFDEITFLARIGELKHASGLCLDYDECHAIESEIDKLTRFFGFAKNASFGIGSANVSKDAHRGYEVKKVLEKTLAEHKDPNPKGFRGVNYDGLVVRYTNDPAPVAQVQVHQNNK